MTLEEEKRALVLECTCDRMHWKVKRLRARQQTDGRMQELAFWAEQVHRVAGPWLPRWWRTGYAVLARLWSS